MQELRSCYSLKFKPSSWLVPFPVTCLYVTSDDVAKCPRCGGRLKTANQIRRRGWAQVVLGLFLASFAGIITVHLAPFLIHPEQKEAVQGMFLFGLLGVLILLGLNSTISGVSQIKSGRRNKWTLISTWVVLVLLIVCAVGTFASLQ